MWVKGVYKPYNDNSHKFNDTDLDEKFKNWKDIFDEENKKKSDY